MYFTLQRGSLTGQLSDDGKNTGDLDLGSSFSDSQPPLEIEKGFVNSCLLVHNALVYKYI